MKLNEKMIDSVTRQLQVDLSKQRSEKVSLKDIHTVLICKLGRDFSLVFSTTLYNKQGGAYCTLLELLDLYYKKGKLEGCIR